MSNCGSIQSKFSEYLDGRLTGHEMQTIAAHIDDCQDCSHEWTGLKKTQKVLASLGPVPQPPDLLLRIRVAVSHERARSRRSLIQSCRLAWDNTIGPFVLQAAAGFASAVLLRGTVTVLVGMFTRPEMAHGADEPLGMATSPHFLYHSSAVTSNDQIREVSSPVVVEAYINGEGQVYDYRIVSGPVDDKTRAQVENLLLWSHFEPARFFGQPVRGLAVLSFSGVSVRG
ncbi:MAG: zf-HC2 domain-containing protein [Acidobacteriales bacterium]|nr:zf-HC2 domain-containing protein [Terriglobales bacterium]